jgi:hypothetical protein
VQRIGKNCPSRRHRLLLMSMALATWLSGSAGATSLCVQVEKNGFFWRSIPAISGSKTRLNFHHSIYGSRVEEIFRLGADGFHLTKLRYAEHRLVEFYGYEDAVFENGMWVVQPRPAAIPSLSLRTSSDAALSLFLDQGKKSIQLAMPADSVLHLTIARCKDAHNG